MTCPVPFYASHSLLNYESALIGSAAYYTCEVGHRFPNGKKTATSTCQLNAQWEPIENCLGKTRNTNQIIKCNAKG